MLGWRRVMGSLHCRCGSSSPTDIGVAGDGLVGFAARSAWPAAGLEPFSEEARGEAVEVESLGAQRIDAFTAMVVGEADHALHGGEGLFGEVARSEASLGPGQGVASDAPRAGEEDVAVVGPANVTHRLEAVGHVVGVGGVLVTPAVAPMHGDALAAALEEYLDHALAEARCDVAPDVALGHRVVVVLKADMAVGPDLALDPTRPTPRGGWARAGERGARWPRTRRRRVEPLAMGASLSRSSSRPMAAFIASSEKKVSWRSTSRMRVWTARPPTPRAPCRWPVPSARAARRRCSAGRTRGNSD